MEESYLANQHHEGTRLIAAFLQTCGAVDDQQTQGASFQMTFLAALHLLTPLCTKMDQFIFYMFTGLFVT
jgi:hypothetical protein